MKSIKESQYLDTKILTICTDRVFEIKTLDNENIFKLYNFEKFYDNSAVKFNLLCRSNYLEIRNRIFYAEFWSFNNFIHSFKKMYNELSGKASLESSEDGIIEITATKLGRIIIHCDINIYAEPVQYCDLEFDVDQTYLINAVNEIDLIYEELEIK